MLIGMFNDCALLESMRDVSKPRGLLCLIQLWHLANEARILHDIGSEWPAQFGRALFYFFFFPVINKDAINWCDNSV